MADLRIPSSGVPNPALRPNPQRSEAARAAQKAFFEAAAGRAASVQPVQTPSAVRAPAQPLATRTATASQATGATAGAATGAEARPTRLLRPGSLVNIVV